jgi:hypothetical protein
VSNVTKFTAVEGKGNDLDRSVQITEAIKRACYENGEGLALAFVIGCLEIAKIEILEDQKT